MNVAVAAEGIPRRAFTVDDIRRMNQEFSKICIRDFVESNRIYDRARD